MIPCDQQHRRPSKVRKDSAHNGGNNRSINTKPHDDDELPRVQKAHHKLRQCSDILHDDEYGCFVYQVISSAGITVRSVPQVDDEYRTVTSSQQNDLVCINHVRTRRQLCNNVHQVDTDLQQNGPFLHLSDCSGWLFETKNGKHVMNRLHVDTGLWVIYIGNFPNGQRLLQHPNFPGEDQEVDDGNDNDDNDGPSTITYYPMQKIYCDKRVKNPITGVTYYRVQGTYGWILDKMPFSADNNSAATASTKRMLFEERHVQMGLFAFRATTSNITIRDRPSISDTCMTSRTLSKGDIVTVDIICDLDEDSENDTVDSSSTSSSAKIASSQSPDSKGGDLGIKHLNGPYLRLSDGSGWLYQQQNHKKVVESMPIQSGSWRLRVVNHKGIHLARQPILLTDVKDGHKSKRMWATDIHYKKGEIITCDRRITTIGDRSKNPREEQAESLSPSSPSHVSFYRVCGTQGWINSHHDGRMMAELVLPSSSPNPTGHRGCDARNGKKTLWSPDFVRGIASTVNGLTEVSHNPGKRCMTFRPSVIVDQIQVDVYYETGTIRTVQQNGDRSKTKLFWSDCTPSLLLDIFKNPLINNDETFQRTNKKRSRDETDAAMTLVVGLNGRKSHGADDADSKVYDTDTEEVKLRQSLIQFMNEKQDIQKKCNRILTKIQSIDNDRAKEAAKMNAQIELRRKEDEEYSKNPISSPGATEEVTNHCGKEIACATGIDHAAAIAVSPDGILAPRNHPYYYSTHAQQHIHQNHLFGEYNHHHQDHHYSYRHQYYYLQLLEIQSRTCRVCGFTHSSVSARERHERDLHGLSRSTSSSDLSP